MFESALSNILDKASLYKQKVLCNSHVIIYVNNNMDKVPHISAGVPLYYEIFSNSMELEKYSQNPEIKKYIHKFRYFLDNGCCLYLVFTEGSIAGYYWVADQSKFKPYLFTKNRLFDSDITTYFIFFCSTFEKYRNLGIYSYMLTQIRKNPLFHDGRIMISANVTNYASRRGIEKAGFRKFFTLRYLNIGGVKLMDNCKKISEH